MTLTGLLGITGDNPPDLGPVCNIAWAESVPLGDWYEAPFAAYMVYETMSEVWDKHDPKAFAACMDLFDGAFWRRVGWGRFEVLAYHNSNDAQWREWAEEPVLVVRAATLGWELRTAPYKGGLLGLVERDDRMEGVWFKLEYNHGNDTG